MVDVIAAGFRAACCAGALAAATAVSAVAAVGGPSGPPPKAAPAVRSERVLVAEPTALAAAPDGPAPAGPVVYRPPAALHVVRRFDPQAGPYGPGHRGVDLASSAGAAVVSAADGVVTFAGVVAGRPLVVVRHADGVRTEYEPVSPAVRVGARVSGGEVIGRVAGRHRGCPAICLHWGARRGTTYIDPLLLLQRLGPVRLLPWSRGP